MCWVDAETSEDVWLVTGKYVLLLQCRNRSWKRLQEQAHFLDYFLPHGYTMLLEMGSNSKLAVQCALLDVKTRNGNGLTTAQPSKAARVAHQTPAAAPALALDEWGAGDDAGGAWTSTETFMPFQQ